MVSGLEIKSVEWKEKYLIEVQTIEMVEGFILTLILLAIKTAQNLELSLASGGHTHGSDFRRVLSCFGISHVHSVFCLACMGAGLNESALYLIGWSKGD